jgi:Dolichyl-phosphate-mannose-protein mannosyltransferase
VETPATKDRLRWVWIVVALAFCARAVDALRRPFHTDERISLLWSTFSVKYLLDWLKTWDVHPPLFFLLLHFLALANAPWWVPRLLMVAFGTGSVVMLFFIVRIWAGERAAIVAGICAAFMPVLVFYDTWVRMYVLSDALVLAQFLLLSIVVTRRDLAARSQWLLWIGWTLAVVAAGYTLYVAWFAPVAQLLYVVWAHRAKFLAAAGALATAIALWLPQVPTLLHQLGMGGTTFQGFQGHQLSGLFALPGQATIAPELEGTAATLAAAFAWVWLAIGLWAATSWSPRSLLPWLGAPAILTFGYGIATHKLIYLDRYYMLLGYAFAAWSGCAFALAWERHSAPLRGIVAAIVTGVIVLGIAYATVPEFYTADWPGVAKVLAERVQPGDLIIMEQGMPQWSMAGNKDIASHPHMYLFWANQIPSAVANTAKYRRVWVMAYEPRGIDPNLTLLNQLGQHYRLTAAYPFNRWLPAEDVVLLLFTR